MPSSTLDPTITTNLPCIHCGYNLRTLAFSALCPECGQPVRETLASGSLHAADAPWLWSIAASTFLMPLGTIITIIGVILTIDRNDTQVVSAFTALHPMASGITTLILGEIYVRPTSSFEIMLVPLGVAFRFIGLWILTMRPAGIADPRRTSRVVLRSFLCGGLVFLPLVLFPRAIRETELLFATVVFLHILDTTIIWLSSTILLAITDKGVWQRAPVLLDAARTLVIIAMVIGPAGVLLAFLSNSSGVVAIVGIVGLFVFWISLPLLLSASVIFHLTLFSLSFAFTHLARVRSR